MLNPAAKPIRAPSWLWVLLALSFWATGHWGLLSFLYWILVGALIILIVTTRSWRPVLVLLTSPTTIYSVQGASRWFDEKPAFAFYGLPSAGSFNLDPRTRCYWRSTGCCVDGSEDIWQPATNFGLEIMCQAFGWPPKSYHGPYPTQEEAIKLTSSAEPIRWEDFKSGLVKTSAFEMQLGGNQWEKIASEADLNLWDGEKMLPPRLAAVHAGEDCVLVIISNNKTDEPTELIYLFDRKTSWPFARYVIRGHGGYSYFQASPDA